MKMRQEPMYFSIVRRSAACAWRERGSAGRPAAAWRLLTPRPDRTRRPRREGLGPETANKVFDPLNLVRYPP